MQENVRFCVQNADNKRKQSNRPDIFLMGISNTPKQIFFYYITEYMLLQI